jgi:uncharacterized membrane protein YheB (UPF0754 family)
MLEALYPEIAKMIDSYLWLIIPVISALIGWFTNWVAVKMLFRPRVAISILGLKIQGVFPKRQLVLAEKIAHVVSTELISAQDLKLKLEQTINEVDLRKVIVTEIDDIITNKLPVAIPMLGMFLNNELASTIKNLIAKELEGSVASTITKVSSELENKLNIYDSVYDKVANFSSERLEQIIISVMKKELKFIEIIGGIIGLLIGIFQVALVNL